MSTLHDAALKAEEEYIKNPDTENALKWLCAGILYAESLGISWLWPPEAQPTDKYEAELNERITQELSRVRPARLH